jgi:hypothetical protein
MRSLWTGLISFGRINIPVKMYLATRDRGLSFDYLNKRDMNPVRYVRVDRATVDLREGGAFSSRMEARELRNRSASDLCRWSASEAADKPRPMTFLVKPRNVRKSIFGCCMRTTLGFMVVIRGVREAASGRKPARGWMDVTSGRGWRISPGLSPRRCP